MTDNDELKGLGGWLILVGIGIVVNPFRLLAEYIPGFKPFFENGVWHSLITVGSKTYNPYLAALLAGEMAFNSIIIILSFYLIYLFFTKDYLFPKIYIGIVVASVIFIPTDAFIATKIVSDQPMFDPQTSKEFMRTVIVCVIWVPYMLASKRVAVTFVENSPAEKHQSTPEEVDQL